MIDKNREMKKERFPTSYGCWKKIFKDGFFCTKSIMYAGTPAPLMSIIFYAL